MVHILSLPALGTLKQTVLGNIGCQLLPHCDGGVVFVEYPVCPSNASMIRSTAVAGTPSVIPCRCHLLWGGRAILKHSPSARLPAPSARQPVSRHSPPAGTARQTVSHSRREREDQVRGGSRWGRGRP